MKKFILFILLINVYLVQAQAVVIHSLTLTKLNADCDSAVIRVAAEFQMGSAPDHIPFLYYSTTSSADTLIIHCHYDDNGFWPAFGSTTTKTITVSTPTIYTIAKIMAYTTSEGYERSKSMNLCGGTMSIRKNLLRDAYCFYPNPTSGIVTLSGVESQPIFIYNMLGDLISTEPSTNTLDLSKQPNGTYFVKVGTLIKKIIKE